MAVRDSIRNGLMLGRIADPAATPAISATRRDQAEPPMPAPEHAPGHDEQPHGAYGKAGGFGSECRAGVRGDVIECREREQDRDERDGCIRQQLAA